MKKFCRNFGVDFHHKKIDRTISSRDYFKWDIVVNELEIFTPKPKDCKIYSEIIPDAYGFGHYHLYKDIALDFNKIKKFPVSYNDCLNTIKLLNAFYVSSEKNKSVLVKNIKDSKRLGRKNEKISKKYR